MFEVEDINVMAPLHARHTRRRGMNKERMNWNSEVVVIGHTGGGSNAVHTRSVAKERTGIKGVRCLYVTHGKEGQRKHMCHVSHTPTQSGARCKETLTGKIVTGIHALYTRDKSELTKGCKTASLRIIFGGRASKHLSCTSQHRSNVRMFCKISSGAVEKHSTQNEKCRRKELAYHMCEVVWGSS